MFKSLWSDLVKEYRYSNKVVRLIFANLVVFLGINFLRVIFFIVFGELGRSKTMEVVQMLSINADPMKFLFRPWTWVSHMFLHVDFFHFLFNMLFLYWFGRITGDLLGDRRIYPLYFISAWVGVVFFMLFAVTTPWIGVGAYAYGASAAVLGITAAAGATAPDYEIRLIFLGAVKLKYLVAALILIDFLSIGLSNTGGHIAHLGGIAWGIAYVALLRRGIETGGFINSFLDSKIFKRSFPSDSREADYQDKYKPKLSLSVNRDYQDDQDPDFDTRLNTILEKIKEKGIKGLTEEERQFLEEASSRQDR